MKLYLIAQTENDEHDAYDSAVVCAPDAKTARNMNPHNGRPMTWGPFTWHWASSPKAVSVKCLGDAAKSVKKGVVCASYNAG